jgi:NAD(P)-dependent dehydrogenase (short-subunit alcohol dehydrogenase family)
MMPRGTARLRCGAETIEMADALRTALVTGGARRIGKAIVEDLSAHGFAVAIHCNDSHRDAERLAERIVSSGGRAVVLRADLTSMTAAERLVNGAVDALDGPLGVLVNNASIFADDGVLDFDERTWDRHFAIHVKAPAVLTRRFAASLPDGVDGLIVNMIDQRVWKPTPQYFSYSLSKAALWTATQTMAMALAPRIRVNAIGPGPTIANARQREADFTAQVDGLLLKRGPDLSEFGRTIRYLHDARAVTGQMIALDGGQHLAWQTPDVTGMVE